MFSFVRKGFVRVIAITLIALLSFGVMATFDVSNVDAASNITRISGSDRYDTSYKAAYYLKELNGGKKFNTVILTTGTNYPDALGGSYLAGVTEAPLILVNEKNRTKAIDCVSKVMNKDGVVYIIGGQRAISKQTENALRLAGYANIKRLSGEDRFYTNLELLKEADAYSKEVKNSLNRTLIICSGNSFADALSAGATGRPIMVVGNKLTAGQLAYINERGFNRFYVLGGTSAVAPKVQNALQGKGVVIRLDGSDRFATSIKIVKKFFSASKVKEAIIVSGGNFPDGLSAAPIAQKLGSPILMVSSHHIASAYNYLKSNKIDKALVFGGQGLIPDKYIGVAGSGLVAGWNSLNNNFVYVKSNGTIATTPFQDNYNVIIPTTGGIVSASQRIEKFIWPVDGLITSYFGYRDDVPPEASSYHEGLDIATSMYTPVRAVASGVVIAPTGWYEGYGNFVAIQHANGLVTCYGHNSILHVSTGDRVVQGQVIASVGSTGVSTGPHLHFEVRKYGVKQDPLDYLP